MGGRDLGQCYADGHFNRLAMNAPQSIRFRVLVDAQGASRLAFGPVMVPGNTGLVRVVVYPKFSGVAQSGQRVGVEFMEVLWSVYKVAPVAVFTMTELVTESLGGE